MLNLEPIKARLAAAPPGPWKHCPVRRLLLERNGKEIDVFAVHSIPASPALDLVLNATKDISALLEEIWRLKKEVESLRDENEGLLIALERSQDFMYIASEQNA